MKAQSDKRPIGVFDSGVGGLSVLIELQKLLPHENFVFLADQKNVPYGEKTKKQLVGFMYQVFDYFINVHDTELIVVACNTATCNANTELRKKYNLPIVGTVPAVKPAVRATKTGVVGVISTPSTSKSAVLKNIITNFCRGVEVINVGCKNLEDTVERGLDSKNTVQLLERYLSSVKNLRADQLVLGCTHYPFLKKTIQGMVGKKVKLVDSGKAIAKHTKQLLRDNQLKNTKMAYGKTVYFSTGDASKFVKVASVLLKKPINASNIRL